MNPELPPSNDRDQPAVGRPQVSAAIAGLERGLSDLLYQTGSKLLDASRLVERHHIEAFHEQGEALGVDFVKITLLFGQIASLDEQRGGRLHGTGPATFPAADTAVAERLASFRAGRELERTQQRPWPEEEPDAPA